MVKPFKLWFGLRCVSWELVVCAGPGAAQDESCARRTVSAGRRRTLSPPKQQAAGRQQQSTAAGSTVLSPPPRAAAAEAAGSTQTAAKHSGQQQQQQRQHCHSTHYFPTHLTRDATRPGRTKCAIHAKMQKQGGRSGSSSATADHCNLPTTYTICTMVYKPTADMMSEMMDIMELTNTPPATERPSGVRESKGGRRSTPVSIALSSLIIQLKTKWKLQLLGSNFNSGVLPALYQGAGLRPSLEEGNRSPATPVVAGLVKTNSEPVNHSRLNGESARRRSQDEQRKPELSTATCHANCLM